MSNRIVIVVAIAGLLGVGAYAMASRNPAETNTTSTTTTPAPKSKTPAGEIEWTTSFSDAKSMAKPGQIIFVDVYTDWCSWCKYMDKNVYSDAAVKEFAAQHVFVKLDAEDGGEGEAFARANQVQGYPTLLVYNADGKLLAKQPGAVRRPQDFVNWIKGYAKS